MHPSRICEAFADVCTGQTSRGTDQGETMSARQRSLREARHMDKAAYVGGDERFYELSYNQYRPSEDFRSIVEAEIEAAGRAWTIHRIGVWSHLATHGDPVAGNLPPQGWKIHVSATQENCQRLLRTVTRMALAERVKFKFANDMNTMRMMSSKRWPRGGSGKFITLYPLDLAVFTRFIEQLHGALKDEDGSYILSDRRYKDCRCLYYRYGGMRQVYRLDFIGQKVPMLVAPDGSHVPDLRNPYFEVPAWETDPFPSEDDPGEMTLKEGRYQVQAALGFSNTGGVYLALDQVTGEEVVIKEARPHVEMHGEGLDATSRLARERRNLELLGPVGASPRCLDAFTDWENSYLVEERLDAFDLRELMLKHSPLMKARPSARDGSDYYGMCVTIFTGLLRAVDRAHKVGVVIGDISPSNIMVDRSNMRVRLIDLEAAFLDGSDEWDDIHTPGFRRIMKGRKRASCFRDDRYATAVVMFYCLFPLMAMAYIRTDLFQKVLPVMMEDIGWQHTPVAEVIQALVDDRIGLEEAAQLLQQPATLQAPFSSPQRPLPAPRQCIRRLLAFMDAHSRLQPERTLFPLDPFSHSTNTMSLGLGATGVIHAFHGVGHQPSPAVMERYAQELQALDRTSLPPGFLTGLAGIAWSALLRGEVELARSLLDSADGSDLLHAHHSLYHGMAGIGMAHLAMHHATGLPGHLDRALSLARRLADTVHHGERGAYWQDEGGVRIGMGYGQAGVALFLLRLSQLSGDPAWRVLGEQALRHDLSYGFELETGVTTFPSSPEEVNTYEPYLEQGTAGIAKVAIRYGLWQDVNRLVDDFHRKYSGFCGLLYGLSGMLDVFVDAHLYSGDPRYLQMAERPYQGIVDLYLFEEEEGMAAVPGENLFRISFDHGTGIAGVIRALHRYDTLAPDEFFLDALDVHGAVVREVDGAGVGQAAVA